MLLALMPLIEDPISKEIPSINARHSMHTADKYDSSIFDISVTHLDVSLDTRPYQVTIIPYMSDLYTY